MLLASSAWSSKQGCRSLQNKKLSLDLPHSVKCSRSRMHMAEIQGEKLCCPSAVCRAHRWGRGLCLNNALWKCLKENLWFRCWELCVEKRNMHYSTGTTSHQSHTVTVGPRFGLFIAVTTAHLYWWSDEDWMTAAKSNVSASVCGLTGSEAERDSPSAHGSYV